MRADFGDFHSFQAQIHKKKNRWSKKKVQRVKNWKCVKNNGASAFLLYTLFSTPHSRMLLNFGFHITVPVGCATRISRDYVSYQCKISSPIITLKESTEWASLLISGYLSFDRFRCVYVYSSRFCKYFK